AREGEDLHVGRAAGGLATLGLAALGRTREGIRAAALAGRQQPLRVVDRLDDTMAVPLGDAAREVGFVEGCADDQRDAFAVRRVERLGGFERLLGHTLFAQQHGGSTFDRRQPVQAVLQLLLVGLGRGALALRRFGLLFDAGQVIRADVAARLETGLDARDLGL